MKRITKELKKHVDKHGVAAFAKLCNVHFDLVYKWLREERRITPDKARRIEKVTNGLLKKEKLVFSRKA